MKYCVCPIEDSRDHPGDYCLVCERMTESAYRKHNDLDKMQRLRDRVNSLPKEIGDDNFEIETRF